MKRIGFIYEDIFSRENIAYAMEKAACGKRSHDNVKNILNNILKYNSASEEQIRSVENTYRRYYRGN